MRVVSCPSPCHVDVRVASQHYLSLFAVLGCSDAAVLAVRAVQHVHGGSIMLSELLMLSIYMF